MLQVDPRPVVRRLRKSAARREPVLVRRVALEAGERTPVVAIDYQRRLLEPRRVFPFGLRVATFKGGCAARCGVDHPQQPVQVDGRRQRRHPAEVDHDMLEVSRRCVDQP